MREKEREERDRGREADRKDERRKREDPAD